MDARGLLVLPSLLGGIVTLFGFREAASAAGVPARVIPAAVTLGGLSMSLFSRTAPAAADAWQRNALLTDVSCVTERSSLHASGSLVSTIDLQAWKQQLSAFLESEQGQLHLYSSGDCLAVHLQRLIRGDMTAVTVLLVPPGSGLSLHALTTEQAVACSLHYLVCREMLQRFCSDIAAATQEFPVHHGHVSLTL